MMRRITIITTRARVHTRHKHKRARIINGIFGSRNANMSILKWLTEPEKNVQFVTSLGYMPVTQEAFDQYLPAAVEKLSDPMYISLYETYLKTQEAYTFYYAPQLENYLELETRFENLARLKLLAGRTQYLEGAGTLDELVWDTLDSFKLDYGT